MTKPEDALPVVAWHRPAPRAPRSIALVRQSDALSALTLMQQECDELRAALERLMRHFPTDTDMVEAGWEYEEVRAACDAHDFARAALAPKATQPTSEASRGR